MRGDKVNFTIFSKCVYDGMSNVDIAHYLGLSSPYVHVLRRQWKMPTSKEVREKRIAKALETGGFDHWRKPAQPVEQPVVSKVGQAYAHEWHHPEKKQETNALEARQARKRGRGITLDHSRIRALILKGHSDADISRHLGCSLSYVNVLRHRWGLPSGPELHAQRVTERMKAYGWRRGAQRRIADELGLSCHTVSKICRRIGIGYRQKAKVAA